MKPPEILNKLYLVNPRGLDTSLLEASAGGLRDKATKQIVRQARPVGEILMKNLGPVAGVATGTVLLVAATGVVVSKRKVIGDQVKRGWERVQGKTSDPDCRIYDPWQPDPPRTADREPGSATNAVREEPSVGDVD